MKIRLGTSGSALAVKYAEYTVAELTRIGVEAEVVIIQAAGDLEASNTKSTDAALLRGEVDVVVHAMDTLPTQQPEGLVITAVSKREYPADLLVVRPEAFVRNEIFKVIKSGIIGASARHRIAQLLDYRPDMTSKDIQGDLYSQLAQLRSGQVDAIILAAADVNQLSVDLSDVETVVLNTREFVPAPGQGVIAWQCNVDDLATRRIFRQIHHPEVSACTNIERRVLQIMGEDFPLGVHCERDANGNFHCFAAGEMDGEMRRMQLSSSTNFGVAEKITQRLMG